MKKLLGLLGFAAILGMTSLTYAAEPMAASGEMAAPGAQAIKGDLLKIDGEFYVVKDASGKEVRLHVDKTSKLEGTLKAGDKIEAQASEKGHALSIKPAGAAAGMAKVEVLHGLSQSSDWFNPVYFADSELSFPTISAGMADLRRVIVPRILLCTRSFSAAESTVLRAACTTSPLHRPDPIAAVRRPHR